MNILGLETSVGRGSIALQYGEELSERQIDTPRSHAEQLIPCIEAILTDAGITPTQLDAIAFGRGPGSFIGVRLATAVAQGLATAAGIGLAPVSSMAALAWQAALAGTQHAGEELHVIVCLDARMNEVYLAEYLWRNSRLETQAPEQLVRPAAVALPAGGDWVAVGSGFAAYPQLQTLAQDRQVRVMADLEPRARDLIPLAQTAVAQNALVAPADWRSAYLRGESAWQRQK